MSEQLPTVYIETSVISYLTARPSSSLLGAAHQLITHQWWEHRNLYRCFISDVVIRECRAGDPDAASRRLASIKEFPSLTLSDQAIQISEEFLARHLMPANATEDALHIAIAAVYNIDFLLTWNYKHIANPIIQKRIFTYLHNLELLPPLICTPEELLGGEDHA